MLDFARQTSQSVHLCVTDGDAALLLCDVPGGGLVRITLQAGARLDAYATVSGRILQAFDCLTLDGLSAKRNTRSMATTLTQIRERNYERADSSYAIGIVDLGVPVCDHEGQVIAALTASLLRLKTTHTGGDDLLDHLQKCAEDIRLAV